MTQNSIALCIGFLLDLWWGDPVWLWHPVQGIGKIIEITEGLLWRGLHIKEEREAEKGKKRFAGVVLVLVVLACSLGVTELLLWCAGRICLQLKFVLECILCYQLLAMKSLGMESRKVYTALQEQGLEEARHAVSRIVGRDTQQLSRQGVIKAAVETVAENTSDGVVAPLLFCLLFGPVGGVFYKAVNTMDSMIGYRNDRYCYFGTAAARLDDILNFIPARISALGMLLSAFFLHMDGRNAWRIFRRDRYQHKSPNSAQTESVCAGALGLELAGDAWYFGQLVKKPTIGDAVRLPEPEDILRANRLLYSTSVIVLILGIILL